MMLQPALCLLSFLSATGASAAVVPMPDELRVGHWVEIKGVLEGGLFLASAIEVVDPDEEEYLLGNASNFDRGQDRFQLLGQSVEVSEKTTWLKIREDELEGARVKVEGHWRGPLRFSSRTIAARPAGRDRIAGRLDAVEDVGGGRELRVMRIRVFLPDSVAVEAERELAAYKLAPEQAVASADRVRDEDDFVPGTIRLGGDLLLGLRAEFDSELQRDFNLDESDDEDRFDNTLSLRGELTWLYSPRFYGLLGFRTFARGRDDDEGFDFRGDGTLAEAFGYFRDVGLDGLDLQIGRQDFDERREWLWDQNMDAVRLIWSQPGLRAELSASTNFTDASSDDQNTENLIAYITNNDRDRTLGAYVIDRRNDTGPDYYPIHFGVRALGEWLPETELWAEFAMLRGYEGFVDLDGYGFDVGATYEPDALHPWNFTAGFAFGSGDDDPFDGVDENFRQSGLQDNNARFGGVTSFRYYGEIFDPELSNLSILTLGVGRRIGRRSSINLVWHSYAQDEASDNFLDSDLKQRPDGVHRDVGWELDLVLGSRGYENTDLELVLGTFEPGDAFPGGDAAWLAALQVRFRL